MDSNHRGRERSSSPSRDRRSNTISMLIFKTAIAISLGIIFGFMMEKGRVHEPRVIRHQMVFKKMIMLKMFVSAIASGMLGLSIIAMIPGSNRRFLQTCNSYYNKLSDKGLLSSILGGILLGVGITISGSCPTSVFSQVGAGVQNAGYTFLGALAGALLYGITKPIVDKVSRPLIQESSNPWMHSPYFIMALPLAAMFGVIVCSFEILVPWTVDVKTKIPVSEEVPLLERKAWPPYISGAIIGSLQIPLVIMLGESLGGSTSFTIMVSQFFMGPLKKISPFLAKHKWGFDKWWQMFYVSGVIYGAYLSSNLSSTYGRVKGVPSDHAFIGAMLMIYGSRVAGGCTSGHGLSGMSFLSILSVVTIACTFAAAIATGFLFKSMGILKL